MAYKSRGRRNALAACGSRSLVLWGPAWMPLAYLGRKGAQVPPAHQQRGLLESRAQRLTHWDKQALEWLSEDMAVLGPGGRELLVQPGQESSLGVTETEREGGSTWGLRPAISPLPLGPTVQPSDVTGLFRTEDSLVEKH